MNDTAEYKRQKAEQLASERLQEFEHLDERGKTELLSDLLVHQIELELQNRELQDSQTRLEYLRREYMALYDAAPIGYASLDENGMILRANDTLAAMLGLEHEFITRRPLLHFIHSDDQSLFLARFRAFTRIPDNKHIDVRFKSGPDKQADNGFFGRIQGRRIIQGEVPGALGRETLLVVISDISEIRRNELELEVYRHELESLVTARTREVELAREDAENANLAKSRFLANMSHEIRTPMNAIIGMAHLVLQANLEDKTREQMEKLQWSAESLLGILNDILDFSKIEADKLTIESTPFHPAELIESVMGLFKLPADDNGIELSVQVSPLVPGCLLGDPLRISQVLTNLVSNAVKFSKSGGRVMLNLQPVDGEDEGEYQFSVSDTGIGMNAAQQQNLFRPFDQGDSSTTRQFGGTGLGLAISRKLVELMDGSIDVVSSPGRGSTFSFTLRMQTLENAAKASPVRADRAQAAAATRQLQGRHILVVEDNDINQELARELLRMHGMRVATADNGREALSALEQQTFDGVLMDLQMPVMDGYEATRRIRALDAFEDLPIIAMTANAMKEDRGRALSIGMNDYLAKPVDPDLLITTLARWIGSASSR